MFSQPFSPAVRRLLIVVAVVASLFAVAAPASADSRVLRPAGVKGSLVTFDMRGVSVRAIASARVRVGGLHRRLALRQVRRAARRGRLKVRARRGA